jgi:predicted O-methyltransferase YrrM
LYNTFQLAKRYIDYYCKASNGKGHGVHSPFVFNFITAVLNDSKKYPYYSIIEQQRKKLLQNNQAIEVEDFGAGSNTLKSNKRIVKNIAGSSLKPKKYAQLLFRMVQYYQPTTILELGTSLGITTSYLAAANKNGTVFTCEGSTSIAQIAQQNFAALQLPNIQLTLGDFNNTLTPLFCKIAPINLAFIDGNHRQAPTIQYFNNLLASLLPDSIIIFDDIHWSKEMETAWQYIQQHPAVTLTIDLFFIGIVCINPAFKEKQHFSIRF